MALTDVKTKNAKPGKKPFKLTDIDGLYLHVMPNGGKYWRFDYRHGNEERLNKKGKIIRGTRKTLALGAYPEISLQDARDRLLEARKALAHGIDPGQQKKAQKPSTLSRPELKEWQCAWGGVPRDQARKSTATPVNP